MSYIKLRKLKIGTLELCDLPELGIENLNVRVDTGAATSSLHVDNIKKTKKGVNNYVSFDLHPDRHKVDKVVHCKALIEGTRLVKNSSADTENRIIITTTIRMARRA